MQSPPHSSVGSAADTQYVTYGGPSQPGYGYASSAYGQDPYGVHPTSAAPAEGGGGRVGLVVVSVVLAFVVAAALVAYVVTRVLGSEPQPTAPTSEVWVTLPTHLHGWTKMEGKQSTQVIAKALATGPANVHARGAVYGRAGVITAIVVVAPYRFGPAGQRDFLAEAARALKPYRVTVRPVSAGPLGGQMRCGKSTDGQGIACHFVDDEAYGFIDLAGQPKDYLATVLAVRAAVEHKLG